MLPTILAQARALAAGRTTSCALVERALDRIADPAGEGARVFVRVDRERALAEAEASDRLRARGLVPSPLAGQPISIKDLFDIAGQPTPAGSTVLADAAPAERDAPVVARLRAAGAVIVGRTNMTEFAFSGIGLNPHHGTPGNPADRSRIPGGSSSGAAVGVADGMAVMGLGTDTGGSVRIPSALCGLAGFKPTQRRVPLDGSVPLSFSLDSIGPLAPSVACCAIADAVLAGEAPVVPPAPPLAHLSFAVVRNFVLEDLDATVARAFERALGRLSAAGARLVDVRLDALDALPQANAKGGFAPAEAWAWHRALIGRAAAGYDPRVLGRIRRGEAISAADYIDLLEARRRLIAEAAAATQPFDACLMPTVPTVAPTVAEADASDDAFARLNLLMLRNPAVGNFLDRCAVSLPCHAPDELPVGLMLMGENGADRRLLGAALAVEAALAA